MTPSSAHCSPKAFPSAELVDGEPLLRRARRVKTPEEVDAIRASVRVAERSLAEAAAALAPGMTERQLTGVFMEAMASAGVTTPPRRTSRGSPRANTHGTASSRDAPVEPGDLVAFEAGVILGGYVGELGRTYRWTAMSHADRRCSARGDELRDRLLAACRLGAPLRISSTRTTPPGFRRPPCRWPEGWGSDSTFRLSRTRCRARPASSTSRRGWCSH